MSILDKVAMGWAEIFQPISTAGNLLIDTYDLWPAYGLYYPFRTPFQKGYHHPRAPKGIRVLHLGALHLPNIPRGRTASSCFLEAGLVLKAAHMLNVGP